MQFLATALKVTEIKLVALLSAMHPIFYSSSLFKNAEHNSLHGFHSSLVGVHLQVLGSMCWFSETPSAWGAPTGSSPTCQHPSQLPPPHFVFLQPHRPGTERPNFSPTCELTAPGQLTIPVALELGKPGRAPIPISLVGNVIVMQLAKELLPRGAFISAVSSCGAGGDGSEIGSCCWAGALFVLPSSQPSSLTLDGAGDWETASSGPCTGAWHGVGALQSPSY